MSERQPWLRRPDEGKVRGESSQAYDAFRAYLFINPRDRSVRAAAEQIGKADSLLRGWSRKYDWVNRAAAYDSYVVTAQVDGAVDAFAEVRNKHLDVAHTLLDHAADFMARIKPGAPIPLWLIQAFSAAAKVQHAALTLREATNQADQDRLDRVLEVIEKMARSKAGGADEG